jgi:predicted outer membrane repeat protein
MKKVIISLALVVIFNIVTVHAATRYVTITGADTTDCSNSGQPCRSLSRAVNQALSGDTISVGAGTFPSLNNIDINVAKNLVINGAGSSQTIFDLNKQGRGLIINGNADCSISGLTIKNGLGSLQSYNSIPSVGGGIIVDSASLTMQDVVLDGCSAPGTTSAMGGCLYSARASLSMTNVKLLNCHSGIAGGWYSAGDTTAIATGVSFINCSAIDSGWGGGFVPDDTTDAQIIDSLFEGNSAGYGGALDDGTNATYVVKNTIFRSNKAQYGGAIYTFGFAVSRFENCTFTNNVASNAGGVIRTTSSTSNHFVGCTMIDNRGLGSGGAISAFSSETLVADNCYFKGNHAQQNGGAIEHSGPTSIYNSIFEENTSSYIGAVYDVVGTSPVEFYNNTIRSSSCYRGAISINTGDDALPITMELLTFENNVATSAAAGILISNRANVTLVDCVFTNNTAPYGAAIQTTSASKTTLVNNAFNSNRATSGGALHMTDTSTVVVQDSSFTNNAAILNGGAVYHDAITVPTFSSVTFTGNSARNGGAYSVAAGATNCFTFDQVTFNNNNATIGGGAIFFLEVISTCNYDNLCPSCTFSGNTALFGSETASTAHQLTFGSQPPGSLSSSQSFTIDLYLLDKFNQQVQQELDTLIQASILSTNASLQGILQQQVTTNGSVEFQLLKVFAYPDTLVSLTFTSLTSNLIPAIVNLTILDCQAGAETYVLDGQFRCLQVYDIEESLKIAIYVINSVLILLALGLLLFLIFKRKHSAIRKASPVLCWMIVSGAILCYISAYFWLGTEDAFCVLRIFLFIIGFTLMYSSFLVKEWRLYRLFKFDSLRITKITDLALIRVVAACVTFEVVIAIFWMIFFPYLQRVTIDVSSISESITYQCASDTAGFFWALLAINGVLLLLGCLLAIATRNVPANYNESKHLGFSIYNATLTMGVVVPVAWVLQYPNEQSITVAAGILFSTSASLIVLFGPKLNLSLHKGAIVKALNENIEKLERDLAWMKKQRSEFHGSSKSSDRSVKMTTTNVLTETNVQTPHPASNKESSDM